LGEFGHVEESISISDCYVFISIGWTDPRIASSSCDSLWTLFSSDMFPFRQELSRLNYYESVSLLVRCSDHCCQYFFLCLLGSRVA